ncbi:MAG: NCS2 family permease [Metamycoplasmataceae bacterium]
MNKLFTYFKFDSRKAILKKEIIGGLSTFLAMAYILAVNPSLVGDAPIDPSNSELGNASIYSGGLFLATALSAFIGTLFMGLYANLPIGLAPGMGLNAFFAYNVSSQIGFDSALTVTIISGFLYCIVVLTPLRSFISDKIPKNLKLSIGVAIGFFIAFLGLQNSQIIVKDFALVSKLNDLTNPFVILAFAILFLGIILYYLKIPGSIVITMLIGAILVIILKFSGIDGISSANLLGSYGDFGTFSDVVAAGWRGFSNVKMWTSPMTYLAIFCFVYLDFFDTTGTLMALNRMIKLDETDPKWIQKANVVDAISTVGGAGIGATTVTSFVESTVGVGAGAKTGFSTIITAICFGLSIAAWPILQVFMPITHNGISYQPITGPILVLIGTLMITQIKYFEWEVAIDIPMLFLTIIFMTLTNSIAEGIGIGIITFIVLNFFGGLHQKIMHRKKVIETLSFPLSEEVKEIKTREFRYWKRLNWTIIIIGIFSLTFILIQSFV